MIDNIILGFTLNINRDVINELINNIKNYPYNQAGLLFRNTDSYNFSVSVCNFNDYENNIIYNIDNSISKEITRLKVNSFRKVNIIKLEKIISLLKNNEWSTVFIGFNENRELAIISRSMKDINNNQLYELDDSIQI